MIYIRASQLSGFALSVNISHTSHDPAALSKYNPFKNESPLNDKDKRHHLHNKKPILTSHLPPDLNECHHRCCCKTSPGREMRQQGGEQRGGLLPSPCKYTDTALVINLLSVYCVAPTTNGFFFFSPPPSPHSFICLGALTVLFARPSC